MVKKNEIQNLPTPFQKILPQSLRVTRDHLMLRLDFYGESIVMQTFEDKGGSFKMVSAHDIAEALSSQMPFSSGILPENTLWWASTGKGTITALWQEPGTRKVALQRDINKPAERYEIPLPGLIFLCLPGAPPAVYAAYHRPTGPKDKVYHAPLANVYLNGTTCPGNHKYPDNIAEIPDNFFKSFFSHGADLSGRSKKHPRDITQLWKELNGKKEYPLLDLVYHSTVADLMSYRI